MDRVISISKRGDQCAIQRFLRVGSTQNIQAEVVVHYLHSEMCFCAGCDIVLDQFQRPSHRLWVVPVEVMQTNEEGDKEHHEDCTKL